MSQLNYREDKIFVIMNKSGYDYGIKFRDLEPALGRPVDFFILSDDVTAVTAANRGLPFVLDQPDGKLSRRIYDLVSEHVEAEEEKTRFAGLWRRRKEAAR